MPEFSRSKIISHQFHVDNDEVESGIGYDIIIGRDLMVHLGLTDHFKHKVLELNEGVVPMKYPVNVLVQKHLTKR